MARKPARKRKGYRPLVVADADCVAEFVATIMPVGAGAKPNLQAFGDDQGNCRRLVARYPNGWEVTLRFNKRMDLTSRSARIVVTEGASA